MIDPDRIVAVVLAAGASRRFGGDKLLHALGGKPLAAHIADTLGAIKLDHRLAVCPAGDAIRAELFAARGFEVVVNDDPGRGMASSLALGAGRAIALGATAMLVCLADMPYVTADHLAALIAAIEGSDVVATEAGGTRSPPAGFTAKVLPELTRLTGDHGARRLLRSAAVVTASPELVRDIDRPSGLS